MAMLANLRPLPGLYGGGFARVVQVETLPSGTLDGAVQAAVRLERLKDPLAGFRQTLAQYSEGQTVSRPQQPLTSNSITLLQNIDPQQPIVASFPPEQTYSADASGEDSAAYAIELARLETLRQQARAEARQQEEARQEALRQFTESSAREQQPLGPDPLAKLRQSLDTLADDLKLAGLEFDDLTGATPELTAANAALAVKTYAETLAAVT